MTDGDAGKGSEDKTYSKSEYEALEAKFQNWMAKATDYEKKLEGFKGVDPERYRALEEEVANLTRKSSGVSDEDYGKIESTVEKRWKDKVTQLQERAESAEKDRDSFMGQLKGLKIKGSTISKAAQIFNEDALPLIEREIELAGDIEDGETVFKDGDGNIRAGKNGGNMTAEEFLDELKGRFPSTVRPQGRPGTMNGSQRKSATGSGGITLAQYNQMTRAEKLKLDEETFKELHNESLQGGGRN